MRSRERLFVVRVRHQPLHEHVDLTGIHGRRKAITFLIFPSIAEPIRHRPSAVFSEATLPSRRPALKN
jgi:hypothetical protein